MRKNAVGTRNGSAVVIPDSDVVAGSRGYWSIVYSVGERGIAAGGGIRFSARRFSTPQLHGWFDPGYVTLECSNPRATLVPTFTDNVIDGKDGREGLQGLNLFIKLEGEPLQEGETITVHFGSQRAPIGAFAPTLSGTYEFNIATDTSGKKEAPFNGYYLIPQRPVVRVVGGPAASLEVLVPSIIMANEPATLRLVARDKHGNPAEGYQGCVHLSTGDRGSTVPAEVEFRLKDRSAIVLSDVSWHAPGTHRVVARDEGRLLLGRSNPLVCLDRGPTHRLFWGDIHGHTKVSDDGEQSIDFSDYYAYGRDVAGLDFSAVTDHDHGITIEDWDATREAAAAFYDPGVFVTFSGYEYRDKPFREGGRRFGGHDKCVYYLTDDQPMYAGNAPDSDTDPKLAACLLGHQAIVVPHQHFGTNWSQYDPKLWRLTEIYSHWGSSERPSEVRPMIPYCKLNWEDHVQYALAQGCRVGFIGSGDSHSGRPGKHAWWPAGDYEEGLVAAFARSLSREDIWDALWNRRVYATTGERILVDFRLNGHMMGQEITLDSGTSARRVVVRVVGTADVERVVVVRNNEDFYSQEGRGQEVTFELVDEEPLSSTAWYYVRVVQGDGHVAWSSPIWVDPIRPSHRA